jgi:hypothetical protein
MQKNVKELEEMQTRHNDWSLGTSRQISPLVFRCQSFIPIQPTSLKKYKLGDDSDAHTT